VRCLFLSRDKKLSIGPCLPCSLLQSLMIVCLLQGVMLNGFVYNRLFFIFSCMYRGVVGYDKLYDIWVCVLYKVVNLR
jgi:hypothetical protein